MENLALMMIDMEDYFLRTFSEDRLNQMLHSQNVMIDYAMDKKLPIINVVYGEKGKSIASLTEKLYSYNNYHFFRKTTCSALSNEDVNYKLDLIKPKNIFFMGVWAEQCVCDSMIDASRKFTTYTSDDVTGSHENVHKNHPLIDNRKNLFLDNVRRYSENAFKIDSRNICYPEKIFYLDNIYQFIELMNYEK